MLVDWGSYEGLDGGSGDLDERLGCRAADAPVLESRDEWLHGRGADLDERLGGRLADALVLEGCDEGLHGRGADLDERLGGSYAHQHAPVFEGSHEGPHSHRVADLTQRHRGVLANVAVSALQGGDEGLYGRSSDASKRLDGDVAQIPVFESADEGLDGRCTDAPKRLDGSCSCAALLVAQCSDQPRGVSVGLEPLNA